MLRRLLTPGWIALHLFAVVAIAGLLACGVWQWERGVESGRPQNYAYAVEWWLFTAFAVFLWVKTMVDHVQGGDEQEQDQEPVAPLVPPPVTAQDEADDPELAAYNRHLAALHARSQAEQ